MWSGNRYGNETLWQRGSGIETNCGSDYCVMAPTQLLPFFPFSLVSDFLFLSLLIFSAFSHHLSYVLLSVYANCRSRSQRLIPVNNHIGDILFYSSLILSFNTEPSTGPWLNLKCLLCSGLNLSQPFRLAITCPMCASWATVIKADRS